METIEKIKKQAEEIIENKNALNHALKMCDISYFQIISVAEGFLQLFKTQPKIIPIVTVNQGDNDRSCGHPRWYFDSRLQADDVANGRGWYGSKASMFEMSAILIGKECYLLYRKEPIELNIGPEDELERKKKALAKLTDYDKKILGIKE